MLNPPFWLRACAFHISLSSFYKNLFHLIGKSCRKFALDILRSVDFMEISIKRRHIRVSEGDGIPSTADTDTVNSASARKISLRKLSESSNRKAPSTDPFITGFRLVDMEILDSVFRILPCKEYFECSLILQEQTLKRKGCASDLRVFCVSCGWVKDFISSLKVLNQ